MRRRWSRRVAVLALALTAPLMLSSAGLGSDPAASAEAQRAEAAVCGAAANLGWDLEQQITRRVARDETAGTANVVVLNTQGYNYGSAVNPQPERIRLEAKTGLRRGR